MLLRSIKAHLPSSLATFVLAFVVTAGAVAVVSASHAGGTPGAVAAMLGLYGAVALAEQSARSVLDRSHDVALARLRGVSGPRLVVFAAGPLLAVSVVGIVAGALIGVLLAHRIASAWHVADRFGTREVLVAVAILLGAWVTIAMVAAAVIRRPLVDVLSTHPRRRPTSWVTTFLELLVVVGACLAVYEAHRRQAGWVPTIAPALVALAAGQVIMWLLMLTPRLGRRMGLALTTRRLRRDPDPGSVVRVLVAAAVLLAVTLTGGRAAADWRDDAGRLRAGGPLVVPFPAGALRAYAASHDADPRGRWLMAATAIDDLSPSARRVYVDSRRWGAVVGDFVSTTSVADAALHLPALADQPGPVLVRSGTVTVDASAVGPGGGRVTINLLTDLGYPGAIHVHLTRPGAVTVRLAHCSVGCSMISVELEGAAFDVSRISASGTSLLGAVSHRAGTDGHVGTVGPASPQAALATTDLTRVGRVEGIDGTAGAVHVVGSVGAVPFVGRSGWLLDLGRVLRGAVGTVASARAVVVARADTPASVIARLHRDGGGTPTTYAAVAARIDHTREARADWLALFVAVGVALIATTHLVAWLAGQTGRRRAEVAGLRAAGVRPRSVRGAYLTEAVVLALIVLVTAAVTALATTVPLLTPMRLVGGWSEAPVLHPAVRPLTLASVLLGVAVVTVGLCGWVFTRFGRSARPSALRVVER